MPVNNIDWGGVAPPFTNHKLGLRIDSTSAWSFAKTAKSSTDKTPILNSLTAKSPSTPFLSKRNLMSEPADAKILSTSAGSTLIAMVEKVENNEAHETNTRSEQKRCKQ